MTLWMSSPDSAAHMPNRDLLCGACAGRSQTLQSSFAQAGMAAPSLCHTVPCSSAPYDVSVHGAPEPVLHARHGRHIAAQDVHVEAEVRHVHQRHLPRQTAVRSPRCCLCSQHRSTSPCSMLRCELMPGMYIRVMCYGATASQKHCGMP